MPTNHEWQSRIKAVEREYKAMREAANRFLKQAQDDSSILSGNLRHRDILAANRNLEGTYIIRLFAEFETGARQYWEAMWKTDIKTFDLFQGLAARHYIPANDLENGHKVRDYRNRLVHEREDLTPPVEVAIARRYLCTFFSYLPKQW